MSRLKRSFHKQMGPQRQRAFLAMGAECQTMTCDTQSAAATACEPTGNLSRLSLEKEQAAVFFPAAAGSFLHVAISASKLTTGLTTR